jgi:hypothetical protein
MERESTHPFFLNGLEENELICPTYISPELPKTMHPA